MVNAKFKLIDRDIRGVSDVKKLAIFRPRQQENVNTYFQSQASYWRDIYAGNGVSAEIYRERHAAVLAWIDDLSLAPETCVLEIGCGAGFMSIALAQRGLRVHAIDSVATMVEQARLHAIESGTIERISLAVGDTYNLAFESESFDLVIAIGVIPWLEHPELAMREMSRVTKPEGYVILTADNQMRLNNLLDPWLNPAFLPLKRGMKGAMELVGLRHPSLKDIGATFHSRRFIDEALAGVALVKTRSKTLGFGPFSLLRRGVFPGKLGTALHHRLQYLADQNTPGLRSTGAHYIVQTRRSTTLPPMHSMSAENRVSGTVKAL